MNNPVSNNGSSISLPLYIAYSVIFSIIFVIFSLFCGWKKFSSKTQRKSYSIQNSSNHTSSAERNEPQNVLTDSPTSDGITIETSKHTSISSKSGAQETTALRNHLNNALIRSPATINGPNDTNDDIYDVPPSRMSPNVVVNVQNHERVSDHSDSDPIYDSPRK